MAHEAAQSDRSSKEAGLIWGCCFCGKDSDADLVFSVVLCEPSGKERTWWCHKDCFIEALRPDYRPETDS